MYFSRTNDKRVKTGEELYASVKIFRAQFENDEWINITETPFSSETFSTQHPALSADEKKLYFSSYTLVKYHAILQKYRTHALDFITRYF